MSKKKMYFAVMTKDHFYCVPHSDLKVCDSSTVVVDDDVKFRRGAQSYNGKVFAVSGSEDVISEHIENMKKAKKKKEDSFHEDKPRKSKLKSREMMSMLKPRSKSLKQSPKKVAATKKRKECQEKAKLQEEMEIETGTIGDDSLDKKGGNKDDDIASVGSTTKASSSESDSESNHEGSKTEGNGVKKDIKLLKSLANHSSSFGPLKLEPSSTLGVHHDLTANTSDKDTVKDKSKKKAKASSLSDSEEEPKEEDKKKQARSSLEFTKEDPKDKKKQADSSPESDKKDNKKEKKKRTISSSDSEEEDSKKVKKTAASSSSESEQKNEGSSSSNSDNEDSKLSPKRKKDKRHASPSGSEDESKPKAKKARRNLEVYPGKNFNWASTDPGVVQLSENLNVYVKEIDLREALRSKSTLLFVRKMVPAVYTTKAMEEATPQGFPERGKGKDYYVGKKPKPRLDPDGWRAIRERALHEQKENKTWRPKVDEQRIMTVFSSVVCSYKK